ncbi:MAG: spondin domain-containing protein [Candidatus Competibacteraceae bacterium]|nr:spondin domain-containing protein [Candidatus Competibacteraceae bacterium]
MKLRLATTLTLTTLFAPSAWAETFQIEITNLTHGNYFTPVLIAAHPAETHLFQAGAQASVGLQTMAEEGDIALLVSDLQGLGADVVGNPAGGLMAPGQVVTTTLETLSNNNTQLSVVAMILPTNDAFIGLDAISLPTEPGRYTFNLNGYDAGTEANDELITGSGAIGTPGIPAAPGGDGGQNGSGVTNTETNLLVHIHRGVLGDTDPTGDPSDLDSRIHRWLNPVARVVVTVQ